MIRTVLVVVGLLAWRNALSFNQSPFICRSKIASPRKEALGAWPEEESQEEVTISSMEINNSSIIPLLDAVHKSSTNKYATVLDIARKARQRAELQQLSQSQSEAQLEAEYDKYMADLNAADTEQEAKEKSVSIADARSFSEDPGARG